ncbi:MAG TPA: hypothetical protein VGA37_16900 [Gemmatimonadales bacterium]
MRRGGRIGLLVMAGAVLAGAASPAGTEAVEPYLSIRTGLKCSQCHTNVTGGGNRTAFGSVFAQTALPWRTSAVVGKALNDVLSVGWDLRAEASGTLRRSTPRTTMGLDVAQVYLEARLLRDRITLYIDETVGPDRAASREAFAMARHLPGNGYAKAGKFLLPFGFRLQDDAEFVRERTGFTYFTPDQGVEVGFEPGPLALSVALTNGSAGAAENNSGKQVSSRAAVVFRHGRIGASAATNRETASRRSVVGGFGGMTVGPLVVMGEVDYIRDAPDAGNDMRQLAAFAEADLAATRGFNIKATYGYLDPNLDVDENQRVRARFGLEAFPVPFVRLAMFYLFLEDIPQARGDLDRVSLEAHLHF